MANLIFSLQPTFTQGLILGQLSILLLLGFILKYLFFDSSERPIETFSYQHRVDSDPISVSKREQSSSSHSIHNPETAEWFNALIQQITDVYRSKLRGDASGPDGIEIARKKVEAYANRIRPAGFLDHITVHSVDLGTSAPRMMTARSGGHNSSGSSFTEFEVSYMDSISLSLSTSYLFNYPMASFARLPVSLTISLAKFQSLMTITPPSPLSSNPVLTISIPPTFTLDLTTTSLMGSRAKLANVPKLHELIQLQVRRVLASKATWQVVLPGLTTVIKVQDELAHELKQEKYL